MEDKSNVRLRDVKSIQENGIQNKFNGDAKHADANSAADSEGRCTQLQENCESCCIPCLVSYNPLPENPTFVQKLKHGLMLPFHGNLASYIQFTVVMVQVWIVLYSLLHSEALPGGNFFSLLILFVCCAIGGYLISFVRLPPLLGMLIVGVLLKNIPGVNVIGDNVDTKWSGPLKKIALTVILTRAGLGLDIIKLKKLSWAVLRLAFIPSTCEIITSSIFAHLLLGLPWMWSLMLGCIMGALSPAVTVPSLVNLQDRKYGVQKGIPTMLLAAGGLDNVLCVTAFSVFYGIIFSDGELVVTIIKGPLGVVLGIVYGFVMGIFLQYIPAKDCANRTFYRSMLLFGSGMIAIFGSSEVGLSGAGPLGCLCTATVAAYKWRQERQPGETDEVAGVMALAWLILQHFLFGLIGAAVNINNIQSNTAGMAIATLAIGLVVRSIASFTVTLGTGFNFKERIFIVLTWLSKATVQAAIGGWALDRVTEETSPDPERLQLATDVLTVSVLCIVICAPTGATLMAVLGPKFLVKGDFEEEVIEVKSDNEKPSKTISNESVVYKSGESLVQSKPTHSSLEQPLVKSAAVSNNTVGFDNPAFENQAVVKTAQVQPEAIPAIGNQITNTEQANKVKVDTKTAQNDSKLDMHNYIKPNVDTTDSNIKQTPQHNTATETDKTAYVDNSNQEEENNGIFKTVLEVSNVNSNAN